jgi:hypothetical protein
MEAIIKTGQGLMRVEIKASQEEIKAGLEEMKASYEKIGAILASVDQ